MISLQFHKWLLSNIPNFHVELFVLLIVEAEICEQNELGQEVMVECLSLLEPFCCTNNGRVTCCTEDEYNRRLNGLR